MSYFSIVDEVPKRANYNSPPVCQAIIEQFLGSKAKVVRLNTRNIPLKAPYNSLRDYLRDHKIYSVKIQQRSKELYLVKMEQ